MDFRILGSRRSGSGGGDPRAIQSNEFDELLTAQGLPSYTEMTRIGDGWTVQTSALFAPIAAYPSTTARLEVFNNRPGYCIVVADVFASQVLATAVSQAWAIFAMVTTQKAAPTVEALALTSLSGKSIVTPTASGAVIPAVDTTVVANGWRPWGKGHSWGTAAATPGGAEAAPVDGKLIAPYGTSVCVAPQSSVATASSFQCGLTFYWVKMEVSGVV